MFQQFKRRYSYYCLLMSSIDYDNSACLPAIMIIWWCKRQSEPTNRLIDEREISY